MLPPTGTTKNVISGYPSPFKDPATAVDFFRRAYPGEVGLRNVLRGDGYYSIDLSVSKSWAMPWANTHHLRFRWDTFNLTNTPSYDVQFLDVYPGPRVHVRPLLQHHRDLRRRRRALHAVRVSGTKF